MKHNVHTASVWKWNNQKFDKFAHTVFFTKYVSPRSYTRIMWLHVLGLLYRTTVHYFFPFRHLTLTTDEEILVKISVEHSIEF